MNFRRGNIGLIILPILLVLFIGTGGYLYFQNQKPVKINQLLAWEECIKIPGAVVQESYPSKCVTSDGRSVTQTLSEEEKKKLQTVDETVSWRIYQNETYGFSFKYPPSSEVVQQESPKGIRLNSIQGGHSGRGYNLVVEPISNGTSPLEQVAKTQYDKRKFCGTNTTITDLISTQIDRENAYSFEYKGCFGGPATEVFLSKNNTIYHISMLYSSSSNAKIGDHSEDKDKVLNVLSTFKFIDQKTPGSCKTDGDCPETDYCVSPGTIRADAQLPIQKWCYPRGSLPQ